LKSGNKQLASKHQKRYKLEKQESIIKNLEKQLKNLEINLGNATKSQNITAVAKLGEEYTLLEKQLSNELEKWVNF
jgi:hypothetical protein